MKEVNHHDTQQHTDVCVGVPRQLSREPGEYQSVDDIADKAGVPQAYCQKVLYRLSRAGLVRSVKGKGFVLNAEPGDVTVSSVALSLERSSRRSYPGPDVGADALTELRAELERQMSSITVKDLAL